MIAISAPQDRNASELHVITENNKIGVVHFANDDGSPVEIDFSHVSIQFICDAYRTFGEFEYLNKIDDGYEAGGNFGIFWIKCKAFTYSLKYS